MASKLPNKGEVIIAGLGGAGILTAGTLLAEAAASRYKNVTWFPSYAISKRGGLCECTIIFSDTEIASPLLFRASGIIVAEAEQFKVFESRLHPGGTMVIEKAGLQAKSERKDIRVIEAPAIEIAIRLSGTSQGANLVLLGAFVGATRVISSELIKQQIKESFTGNEKVLIGNLESFNQGLNLTKNL